MCMYKSSTKQIQYGAIISYVAIFINIATGLIYTPWMVSSIGRENYGLYTLALSVISLFVFDFGLSSAVTRYVAKYLAEDSKDKVSNCLGLVYKLYIYLDIILLLLLAVVYFFIPSIYCQLTPSEIESFKIVYVIAAISSVLTFPFIPVNGILNAHELFIELKLCDVFHKLLTVATMTCCLFWGYGLIALILVHSFATIVIVILKCIVLKCKANISINWGYEDNKLFKEIIGFSGWVTVIAISQRLTMNVAPSILGVLSGSVSIAILGVAITLEGYTYTFSSAINGMFLPKVSRLVNNDKSDILQFMIRIGRIQFYITGFVITTFVCFGKNFILIWMGEPFVDSYLCALLLMAPAFIHHPQEIGDTAVIAMNRVKEKGYAFIVMGIVSIILAVVFGKYWGAIGVSLSICIAYFVRTFCMDVIYYKLIHIDVVLFFKETLGQMWWQFILVITFGLLLNSIVAINGWMDLIGRGILYSTFFVGIMYFYSFNEEEKNLIKKLL